MKRILAAAFAVACGAFVANAQAENISIATGGTGGVSYLAKALELKFFPELWQIRTSM